LCIQLGKIRDLINLRFKGNECLGRLSMLIEDILLSAGHIPSSQGRSGLKTAPLESSKIVLAKICKEKKSNKKEEVSKSQISTEYR